MAFSRILYIFVLVSNCHYSVNSENDKTEGLLVKIGKLCASLPNLDADSTKADFVATNTGDFPLEINHCAKGNTCKYEHSLRIKLSNLGGNLEAIIIKVIDENAVPSGRFPSFLSGPKIQEIPCCIPLRPTSTSPFANTFIAYQTIGTNGNDVEFIWMFNKQRPVPQDLRFEFFLVDVPNNNGQRHFRYLKFSKSVLTSQKFKASAGAAAQYNAVIGSTDFPFEQLTTESTGKSSSEYFLLNPIPPVTDKNENTDFEDEYTLCMKQQNGGSPKPGSNKTRDTDDRLTLEQIYSGCETTKGCKGDSPECIKHLNCSVLTTYDPMVDGYYRLELQGKIPEGYGYVAVGYSRDTKMGDDLVIECSVTKSGVKAVHISWNDKHKNKRFPHTDCFSNTYGKISRCNITVRDGRILCNVYQKMYIVARGHKFNTLNEDFYLMIAWGSNVTENGIGYHDKHTVSSRKIHLKDIFASHNDLSYEYVVHGSLMLIAWMILIPNSIFIARYFKESFTHIRFLGKCLWTPVHVTLNLVAFLLIGISLWKVFYANYNQKKHWPCDPKRVFHAKWGLALCGLMALQIIMGWSYPSSKIGRKVFACLHYFTGNCACIIALVLVVTSTTVGLPCHSGVIVIVWVLWVLFWNGITAYHFLLIDKIVPYKRKKDYMNRGFQIWPMSAKLHTEAPFAKRRLQLLLYHFLGTFVLTFSILIYYWLSDTKECFNDPVAC